MLVCASPSAAVITVPARVALLPSSSATAPRPPSTSSSPAPSALWDGVMMMASEMVVDGVLVVETWPAAEVGEDEEISAPLVSVVC